eukprot:TRINITY_DN3330_c0_g1_i1.p1 TRINITY_DN3330_c0_g1~~TRINITY_DN3330_c0_g1_i1.p1  ORF type:complete len:464 (+),score=94.19 TRINITY_DN3330_c0_g1_i1:62-1453(+)
METKTLWVGDVDASMDENYLLSMFPHSNAYSAKVIRDKTSMSPVGYGFVDFLTHEDASRALQNFQGLLIPGTGKRYRLNWATATNPTIKHTGQTYTLFVGDLSAEVNDMMLMAFFATNYKTVISAKVIMDPNTNVSKGYGFVRFADESESNQALFEMQGKYCGSRAIRVSTAVQKKGDNPMGQLVATETPKTFVPGMNGPESDPNNTTIFVGNIDEQMTEDYLRMMFTPYGEIAYIKMTRARTCAFVTFAHKASAEAALAMNGQFYGSKPIRISWGRAQQPPPGTQPATQSYTQPTYQQQNYQQYDTSSSAHGYNYNYAATQMTAPYSATEHAYSQAHYDPHAAAYAEHQHHGYHHPQHMHSQYADPHAYQHAGYDAYTQQHIPVHAEATAEAQHQIPDHSSSSAATAVPAVYDPDAAMQYEVEKANEYYTQHHNTYARSAVISSSDFGMPSSADGYALGPEH